MPAAPPEPVSLREITAETVISVIKLAVAEDQGRFVAPNAVSLAQALFAPDAWFRAIYLGEAPAGFVMLEDATLRTPPPPDARVLLWRLMVDARFQGQGVGRAAMAQVIAHVAGRGHRRLYTSYVPGPGCPEPFYRGLGFVPTGEVDEGEVVMALEL